MYAYLGAYIVVVVAVAFVVIVTAVFFTLLRTWYLVRV